MAKKLGIILLVLFVIVLVLAFGKNIMIKTALTSGVKAITGLDLEIDKMNIGLLNTLVDIRGLKLLNPKGFKDNVMIEAPEIYVNYDLGGFFKGKAHFEELRFNLKELVVVRNEQGELNLDSLKGVKGTQAKKSAPEKKTISKKDGRMPELQIDLLRLKIGKVVYKDYSGSASASIKEFNVNIDESYKNITDPSALVRLLVFKALTKTTIANLINFDMGLLGESIPNIAGEAVGVAAGAVEKAKETAGKLGEDIKNILPFGK